MAPCIAQLACGLSHLFVSMENVRSLNQTGLLAQTLLDSNSENGDYTLPPSLVHSLEQHTMSRLEDQAPLESTLVPITTVSAASTTTAAP